MTVTIGPYSFDHADYDAFGDVAYLRLRQGLGGVGIGDTPEGHAWLVPVGADDAGEIVGVDFHSPRAQLEQTGKVTITLPDGTEEQVPAIEALVRA